MEGTKELLKEKDPNLEIECIIEQIYACTRKARETFTDQCRWKKSQMIEEDEKQRIRMQNRIDISNDEYHMAVERLYLLAHELWTK